MPCYNDLEGLKEFKVVCDATNNTEQGLRKGHLIVDLVFYGSLAQHVRDRLSELQTPVTSD